MVAATSNSKLPNDCLKREIGLALGSLHQADFSWFRSSTSMRFRVPILFPGSIRWAR